MAKFHGLGLQPCMGQSDLALVGHGQRKRKILWFGWLNLCLTATAAAGLKSWLAGAITPSFVAAKCSDDPAAWDRDRAISGWPGHSTHSRRGGFFCFFLKKLLFVKFLIHIGLGGVIFYLKWLLCIKSKDILKERLIIIKKVLLKDNYAWFFHPS